MIDPTKKYFPEGLALNGAFINRSIERAYLLKKIKANKHSVLIAPRRYGKTSLVMKVAQEMGMPYVSLDLLAAYGVEYVRDQILDKAGQLAIELLPKAQKAKQTLVGIFKQMKPELSLGAFGQKLTLQLSNSPLQDITEALLKLDETAKQFKKRAVIFFDEFQQISQLKNYHNIEAAIRHAVERSECIAYVFSGSDRRLLQQMFGDKSRALYKLCQLLHLDRIDKAHYQDYLQKLSQETWGEVLSMDVIDRIVFQAQLHPFYMNVLCQQLWESDSLPTIELVDSVWHEYVKTQRYLISHDMTALSINQRKVMMALAQSPVKETQSAHFTGPIKISASSAQQAVEVLRNKDLIYKNKEGHYVILDPAMQYYLNVVLREY